MNSVFICCLLIATVWCDEIPAYANPAKLRQGEIAAITLGVIMAVAIVMMVVICCCCLKCLKGIINSGKSGINAARNLTANNAANLTNGSHYSSNDDDDDDDDDEDEESV